MPNRFDYDPVLAALYARASAALGITTSDVDQPRRETLARVVFELAAMARRDPDAAFRAVLQIMKWEE